MAAPRALALGDDSGTTWAGGNGARSVFGTQVTKGDASPQAALVQSSLSKLCVGLPAKANAGSVVGLMAPGAVQAAQRLNRVAPNDAGHEPRRTRMTSDTDNA